MASESSKRRKIASSCALDVDVCDLLLLPRGILAEVSTYLSNPSKILFAITVAPPSSPYNTIMARNTPSVNARLIAGDDWDTLDFGDIEKELAAKLTDDHLSKVLLHIDAANNLKRLRLTNCINITGSGLVPLSYSISIEQIDMGSSDAANEVVLLPILERLIGLKRNSFKHLQFPSDWRWSDEDDHSQLTRFIEQYNEMIMDRVAMTCGNCYQALNAESYCYMEVSCVDGTFGTQNSICNVCLCVDNSCRSCRVNDNSSFYFCVECEQNYCWMCSAMDECVGSDCKNSFCENCSPGNHCAGPDCSSTFCNDCYTLYACRECEKSFCDDCGDENFMFCSSCHRICGECSAKEVNGVHTCTVCFNTCCGQGRLESCERGHNNCKACLNMISSLLLEKSKTLQAEVKEMKAKNNELWRKINDLTR